MGIGSYLGWLCFCCNIMYATHRNTLVSACAIAIIDPSLQYHLCEKPSEFSAPLQNHDINHFTHSPTVCMLRGVTLPEERLEDNGDVPRSRFADKFHFTSFDQVVISATWNRERAGLRIVHSDSLYFRGISDSSLVFWGILRECLWKNH